MHSGHTWTAGLSVEVAISAMLDKRQPNLNNAFLHERTSEPFTASATVGSLALNMMCLLCFQNCSNWFELCLHTSCKSNLSHSAMFWQLWFQQSFQLMPQQYQQLPWSHKHQSKVNPSHRLVWYSAEVTDSCPVCRKEIRKAHMLECFWSKFELIRYVETCWMCRGLGILRTLICTDRTCNSASP